MKILIMSDSPGLETGMGVVHRNIGKQLQKYGHTIVSIGWSPTAKFSNKYWPEYTPSIKHYYGQSIFDQTVFKERPDVVLTIGDPWTIDYIVNSQCRSRFHWISYTAIDGELYSGGVPSSWLNMLRDADNIVAYTYYGKHVITKSMPTEAQRISIIPHGVDVSAYFPIGENNRQAIRTKFGIPQGSIIYLIVARNQFRKNIPEIFKAWGKFKTPGRNAFLFPHMVFNDARGWNLNEVIDACGIAKSLVYIDGYAKSSSHLNFIDIKQMNAIYNVADVFVLMSGEGFGLPLVEAMACGKPIIALDHSACTELVRGRGELVRVSNTITGAHCTERPLFDINDLVEKFALLYGDEELRLRYGKNGFKFAQSISWDIVGQMWQSLIEKIENPFIGKINLERIC